LKKGNIALHFWSIVLFLFLYYQIPAIDGEVCVQSSELRVLEEGYRVTIVG
jgi:hypothetical protein